MSNRSYLLSLFLLGPLVASAQIPNTEWIIPQQSEISDVTLSGDGRFAATAGWHDIKVWNVATGTIQMVFQRRGMNGGGFAFAPDKPILVTSTYPFGLRFHDVESRRFLFSVSDTAVPGASSLCFSPDGRMIATLGYDSVRLWRSSDGARIRTLPGRSGSRNSLQFSADGLWLFAGGIHGVEMWDVTTGRHYFPLLDRDTVESLAVSSDGRTIATQIRRSWEDPDPARLWDLTTGDSILTIPTANTESILRFSPDGTEIMTTGQGVQVWDVTSGALKRVIAEVGVEDYDIDRSGTLMLVANRYGNIQIRDRLTGDSLRRLTTGRWIGDKIRFSPAGDRIALYFYGQEFGWDESGIGLVDAATGAYVGPNRIDAGYSWDNDFEFSPDGRFMAGIWRTGVRIADVSSGDSIRAMQLPGVERVGRSLSWSPDNSLIATSGDTLGRVQVWRFDGELDRLLPTGLVSNNVVRFSPDGRWLVAHSDGYYPGDSDLLSIWNTSTWERRQIDVRIDNPSYHMSFVEFLPDSRTVAIGGTRPVIGLWDIISGRRIGELPHDSIVRDAAISRDGRYLVAAVMDGTVRVWDLVTRSLVHTYDDYPIDHWHVEISPDSKQILSSAEDGSIIMWRAIDRMSGVPPPGTTQRTSLSAVVEPNPVCGSHAVLTLSAAPGVPGRIEIRDIGGSFRKEFPLPAFQNRVELDLSDLESGIYFVRASFGDDAAVTESIVISR